MREALRKETEKCDRLSQINITADLSGGTGSSLIRHLDSNMRQYFKDNKIHICSFL